MSHVHTLSTFSGDTGFNAGRTGGLKAVVDLVSSGQGQATSDEYAITCRRLLRIIDSVRSVRDTSNGRPMAVKGPLNPPVVALLVQRWAVQVIGGFCARLRCREADFHR